MIKIHCLMGLWSFSEPVSLTQLEELATDWLASDKNYAFLAIRKSGGQKLGIEFVYRVDDALSLERVQQQYLDKTTKDLERRFGPNLIGWDIGAPAYMIKSANF